ncbi:hypothetical protein OsJ_32475 [Oryza sativa Japonica Group]|uniref:No apical meristem-associated C-terminal domain-containing protein n=1 Tax=Oryza sativa subsp. japonica TaxID=39947 RepID=B9G709_ORYSJ|nr:hypothetical protein OsJ_32475 [Oryza sativa Japonica Group]
MSCRSKRQVAPRPPPPSSSPPPPPPSGSTTASGCFDAASSAFFQASTAMAPPLGGQPGLWNGSLPHTNSFDPASSDCGMDIHPPGGFLSMLQSGQQPLVPPHVLFPATWPPMPPMAPTTNSGTIINLDDGDDVRTAKRLTWASDEDLRLFYVDDYPNEGPFTVLHCWKVLRDEPKWHAVLEELEKPHKRSLDDGSDTLSQKDIGEKERPMGRNEAKKQRNGKGKGKGKDDDDSLHEDMKKYMDVQAAASKRHEEFLGTQHRISDAKVEVARLRREAVLTESYQKLMSMDTSQMTDEIS